MFTHSSVRKELARVYRGRCAFCESENASAIHHYRPLSRYPWLADDWSNLLLTCDTCERIAHDRFPLPEPDTSLAPSDIKARLHNWRSEQPRLLHPDHDQPGEHLEVWPNGSLRHRTERGSQTIETFQLNRDPLREARRKVIDDLMGRLRGAAEQFVDAMQAADHASLPQVFHKAFVDIFEEIRLHAKGGQPYARIARDLRVSPGRFLNERLGADSIHRHIAYAAFQKFVRDDPKALESPLFVDVLAIELRRRAASMSNQFARWQGLIDPAVRQVFEVQPVQVSERADTIGAGRVVVVRSDIDEMRLSDTWQGGNFLDLPETALDDARHGRLSLPTGFASEQWREVVLVDPRPPAIEIRDVSLRNFRCFADINLAFASGINVIIGKNGTGKTTILDALAHTLSRIIRNLAPAGEPREIRLPEREIRRVPVMSGDVQRDERKYPVRLDIPVLAYRDQVLDEYNWDVTSQHNRELIGTGPISRLNILDMVRWSATTGHDVPLPVFAYYDTKRTAETLPEDSTDRHKLRSRIAGYLDWRGGARNQSVLEQWFNRMQLLEVQRGEPGVLKATRSAFRTCLEPEGITDVRYDANLEALAARQHAGAWVPFAHLSDGARNALGLVLDLAMRCALLNPHLGERAASESSGVVLIDELDLHLHPTWQSHIIDDLRRAFPRVQFIITTHSPLLISPLRPDEVLILERDDQGQMSAQHPDWDPRLLTGGELFRRIFGVKKRPPDPVFRKVKHYEYLARSPYRTDEEEHTMLALGDMLRTQGVKRVEEPVPREPLREDDA